MNHSDLEDKTQGNAVAERYLALLAEYRVFEERLQTALAHKERFSEKVLAKVTSEYRTRLEQLSQEGSTLEGQLRSELAGFEKQLQALIPARQRFVEEMEELELRHLTGELATKDLSRRKAALEGRKPAGIDSIEVLQTNVEYYQQILAGVVPAPASPPSAPDADSQRAGSETRGRASGAGEAEPSAARPSGIGTGGGANDVAAATLTPAAAGSAPDESEEIGEEWFEVPMDADADAAELAPEAVEEDIEPETLLGADLAPYSMGQEAAEATFGDVEPGDLYAEEDLALPELEEEVGSEEHFDQSLEPHPVTPDLQAEEDFFASEFRDTSESATDWYDTRDVAEHSTDDLGAQDGELDRALEDLDEFAGQDELSEDDVQIPEELLLDEDDDYLDSGVTEDSAALLESTERLLEEDAFEEDLIDTRPSGRRRGPAVVLHEGQPDEKIYYMTNKELTIGRGPDNDIQLPTDTSVSRHHSRITFEDDEYRIADLGSSNGTIVNGARVSKTVLSGEDEIAIGQTMLRFRFI